MGSAWRGSARRLGRRRMVRGRGCRQEGSGRARSLARAFPNWFRQGQSWGRCRVEIASGPETPPEGLGGCQLEADARCPGHHLAARRRWHRRRKDSPQCICEPDLGIHPPASSALLIPAVLRPNGRYVKSFVRAVLARPWRSRGRLASGHGQHVKSFVRGFGCRCGITAGRSSCPKLRMLSAATIRVPANPQNRSGSSE